MTALTLVTAAKRPELVDEMLRVGASPWPTFLDHDDVVEELWESLYELAPGYQFGLIDEQRRSLAAVGNCIPIRWDGNPQTLPERGIDAVLEDGVACLRDGATPTAASALMIVVDPERLGQGISGTALAAMAEIVGRHGLADLVAPVRPTEKHRYPLVPIERYIEWRRDDGLPFDPWLRVHERVGGEILRSAGAAMRVTGSVAEWERWTAMALPERAHTWYRVRSCRSRSTASATWASTSSPRAGSGIAWVSGRPKQEAQPIESRVSGPYDPKPATGPATCRRTTTRPRPGAARRPRTRLGTRRSRVRACLPSRRAVPPPLPR